MVDSQNLNMYEILENEISKQSFVPLNQIYKSIFIKRVDYDMNCRRLRKVHLGMVMKLYC